MYVFFLFFTIANPTNKMQYIIMLRLLHLSKKCSHGTQDPSQRILNLSPVWRGDLLWRGNRGWNHVACIQHKRNNCSAWGHSSLIHYNVNPCQRNLMLVTKIVSDRVGGFFFLWSAIAHQQWLSRKERLTMTRSPEWLTLKDWNVLE